MAAIELDNFCIDNIGFELPQKKQFTNGSYHRIPITYTTDNIKSELCIATNTLMTWGIQENRKQTAINVRDGPIEYYTLPLVISDEQTRDVLTSIFNACRTHIDKKDVKVAMGKYNLAPESMQPFYWKRDSVTGDVIEGSHPTLYPKLLTKYQKIQSVDTPPVISTEFLDRDENPIDPQTLIGCRAQIVAALTIKEIYIGSKPSIQIKVNDVIVLERMTQFTRRLGSVFKKIMDRPPSNVLECALESETEQKEDEVSEAPVVEDKKTSPVFNADNVVKKYKVVPRQKPLEGRCV